MTDKAKAMDRDSVRKPAGSTVLVLGGTGFIGRHVVAALRAQGCRVAIGSRAPLGVEIFSDELAKQPVDAIMRGSFEATSAVLSRARAA